MALDRYFGENLNVKKMALENPERRDSADPRVLYEELKGTEFYDPEKGLWNDDIRENQTATFSLFVSLNQLYGVLAEMIFDKRKAQETYEKLKESSLYNNSDGRWNNYLSSDESGSDMHLDRFVDSQLINILILSSLDQKKAKNEYDRLKQTPLYDDKNNQWFHIMSQFQQLLNGEQWSSDHLLGVLVEFNFDKEKARKMFNELKTSSFYDAQNKMWNLCTSTNNVYWSDTQLLGVLAESLFDKEAAAGRYAALKQSALYDRGRKQWLQKIDEGKVETKRPSGCQLLAVLVEHALRENFRREKSALPEARKF